VAKAAPQLSGEGDCSAGLSHRGYAGEKVNDILFIFLIALSRSCKLRPLPLRRAAGWGGYARPGPGASDDKGREPRVLAASGPKSWDVSWLSEGIWAKSP
jgi:hypothetical protein